MQASSNKIVQNSITLILYYEVRSYVTAITSHLARWVAWVYNNQGPYSDALGFGLLQLLLKFRNF